ncbi:MAG: universal stress protein [Actinobacteria bacterium]|nr:universal stress protein [Actinomycetota bacterium]
MTTAAGRAGPHVVVGVDGSAESIEALSWSARYAAATGATISAVHAWHQPASGLVAPDPAPQAITDQVRASMQELLNKALTEVFGSAAPPGVDTKVACGHPAMVLVNESQGADLLVVGNRGHGAFRGMLLGSVSIHCVTNATCPVVVVRTPS